jgi:hypothetical protein
VRLTRRIASAEEDRCRQTVEVARRSRTDEEEIARRRAGASGGLNGAMTAVFGIVVGIVLAIIWIVLGLIPTGGERLPAAPVGFGGIAGGAFLAGLILLLVNLFGGYLGGKLGEPGRG